MSISFQADVWGM